MPISRPMDQRNLLYIPAQYSIEPIHYTFPVTLGENFYVDNPWTNQSQQVASRILSAIVDLTKNTQITYMAQNGQTLTYTITHNGIIPLHCWGVFTAGAGILNLEWGV